ncbi:MAG TPA: L,D-transpeptidase family protein [Thermoanaerobaculia bacterium]|nr:L,D-transpeptidase family protein [Thermoanaerobaculia bacterium]
MRRSLATIAVIASIAATVALASRTTTPALHADKIVIEKAARKLTLYNNRAIVKTYQVALGPSPVGPKQCQGDKRTPEGLYRIDGRNSSSHYHRSLHVSYPNAHDLAVARGKRCSPGGDIMIHGITNGYGWLGAKHRAVDWTLGCIAVTDDEIEEIWNAVPNGTVVEIKP